MKSFDKEMLPSVVFATVNIVHLAIVFRFIIPPMTCPMTCILSLLAGSSIVPVILTLASCGFPSRAGNVYETCMHVTGIALTIFTPVVCSFLAKVSNETCPDSNWYIWYVQGLTIPASAWSVYQNTLKYKSSIRESLYA